MTNTCEIICGDCLEVMRNMDLSGIDAVITDPPYPDYFTDVYGYDNGAVDILNEMDCKQLVFWTAKENFPLDYTAVHIWDKKTGCGSEYERIFERNGGNQYKMFRYYLINSTVAASFAHDEYTEYPSQKPIRLLTRLIEDYTKPGDTILDPFAGSGTTGVACIQTGRNFIGIEISEDYCAIANRRIKAAQSQLKLDLCEVK